MDPWPRNRVVLDKPAGSAPNLEEYAGTLALQRGLQRGSGLSATTSLPVQPSVVSSSSCGPNLEEYAGTLALQRGLGLSAATSLPVQPCVESSTSSLSSLFASPASMESVLRSASVTDSTSRSSRLFDAEERLRQLCISQALRQQQLNNLIQAERTRLVNRLVGTSPLLPQAQGTNPLLHTMLNQNRSTLAMPTPRTGPSEKEYKVLEALGSNIRKPEDPYIE